MEHAVFQGLLYWMTGISAEHSSALEENRLSERAVRANRWSVTRAKCKPGDAVPIVEDPIRFGGHGLLSITYAILDSTPYVCHPKSMGKPGPGADSASHIQF